MLHKRYIEVNQATHVGLATRPLHAEMLLQAEGFRLLSRAERCLLDSCSVAWQFTGRPRNQAVRLIIRTVIVFLFCTVAAVTSNIFNAIPRCAAFNLLGFSLLCYALGTV